MKKLISLLMFLPMSAFATITAHSFTPTSVKIPIFEIGFASGTSNIPAWSCPSQTVSGCTVDIADATALASAFTSGGVSVAAGTYTAMYANTCASGATGYSLSVKGTVTISGQAYTTQSGSDPLTTSATADYASITISGCQANIYFPSGITVTNGQSLTVNLLTSLSNFAVGYANTAGSTNFPSNCIKGSTSALCVSYPSLIPYVGSDTPTVRTYLLTGNSGDTTGAYAFGQFTEFLDSSSNIIGISTGAAAGDSTVLSGDFIYANNTPCNTSGCGWKITPFASPIYKITKNDDGTLALQGYGDNGATDASTATISISNFPLPNVGAVSSSFTLTNPSAKIFSSSATIYTTRTK